MKLCANECVFDESDGEGVAHIWFADQSQTPPSYFTLSREVMNSEQESYFERDDQKWGARGRVTHADLARNSVSLKLEPELARALGLEEQAVEISFTLAECELSGLERCLAAILGRDVVNKQP